MHEITRNLDKSQTISAPDRSLPNANSTSGRTTEGRHGQGVRVDRVSSEESASERARWLAELADALEGARHLVKELGADGGRLEAVELYARIEAARIEVHMMRLKRVYRSQEFDPKWSEGLLWKRSA